MAKEIISIFKLRKINNFMYRPPVIGFDKETGEVVPELDEDSKPINLGNIKLLLEFSIEEEFDEKGKLIDSKFLGVKPVDKVNAFLLECALNGDAQSPDNTKQMSDALRSYFQFLADDDSEKDGLKWNKIPDLQRKKPTFKFKKHMEDSANINVSKEEDRNDDPMAVSTVKAYMRHVTNFYKYLILKNYHFENPPFDYEIVTTDTASNSASQMSATTRREVLTTNLRIKAKSQKSSIPNHLRSMTPFEWETFDDQLRKKGFGLRKVNGVEKQVKISTEIKYQMLSMRYAGLRIEEAATLRKHQVFKPTSEQHRKGYVEVKLSPKNFNDTKDDKARVIEIPANLMLKLFEYTKSARYRQREKLYRVKNPTLVVKQTPLFINQNGEIVSEKSITSRFGELRRAIVKELGQPFDHKPHNLRSTYSVFRIRDYAGVLLNMGWSPKDAWNQALDHVKSHLGHESYETTAIYLRQAEDERGAEEKSEYILEFADEVAGSKFDFGDDE